MSCDKMSFLLFLTMSLMMERLVFQTAKIKFAPVQRANHQAILSFIGSNFF